MKTIKVGGVPEHFNLPWHLCLEEGRFQNNGLDLSWKDFPEGTGAMCKALREAEIDVSVILTEGIIRDIHRGNPSLIVQEYIGSPLIWGIHVAANSRLHKLEDLRNQKIAISRKGSGSHLMAYVNAKNLDWDISALEFEETGDLEGAVRALSEKREGYFLWEHFTTKPLVDQDVFRRIGDCPTPWPCFVIAVRREFLQREPASILVMLKTLNEVTSSFKEIPGIELALSHRYQLKKDDIEQWLKLTRWSQKQLSVLEIGKVQEQLFELNLISEIRENASFITNEKFL